MKRVLCSTNSTNDIFNEALIAMMHLRDVEPRSSKRSIRDTFDHTLRGSSPYGMQCDVSDNVKNYYASLDDTEADRFLYSLAQEAFKAPSEFTLGSRLVRFMKSQYPDVATGSINSNNGVIGLDIYPQGLEEDSDYVHFIIYASDDLSPNPRYFSYRKDSLGYSLSLPRLVAIDDALAQAILDVAEDEVNNPSRMSDWIDVQY